MLKQMPVAAQYSRDCMHGGPLFFAVWHLRPTLKVFQTCVWRNQPKFRDVRSLNRLLAADQFDEMMSHHVARFFFLKRLIVTLDAKTSHTIGFVQAF